MSNSSNGKVELSESEWQARLSPEQFRILRQKGTEPAFSGLYDKHFEKGVYNCAGCDTPLFTSSTKFKSGCGWPAFFDSIEGAVKRTDDFSFGMRRTEITCAKCGGHLGHVFRGEGKIFSVFYLCDICVLLGYPTPTDERHCVNSVSIKFKEQ